MKKLRMVQKIKSGQRFQEVEAKDHQSILEVYLSDPGNAPCPMIKGHQMFKYPKDYGCRLIEVPPC